MIKKVKALTSISEGERQDKNCQKGKLTQVGYKSKISFIFAV
jgi:hypothetical protein